MYPVLVIGSYNIGLTVMAERIPRPGETVLGTDFIIGPGGKGSNQAITVARLGGEVRLLTRIGDDMFGHEALRLFAREGLTQDTIIIDPQHHTGAGIITVDASGQNAISVALGANLALVPEDLNRVADTMLPRGILLVQLETPLETVCAAIRRAKESEMTTILNPAPAQPLPDELYPLIDLLTPNETEAEILTGIPVSDIESAIAAAGILLTRGVQHVVITLGAQGALWKHREGHTLIPPVLVHAIDTTGAGDVFSGAIAYALSCGKALENALEFASAAAAFSVTRTGVITAIPTHTDVKMMLANVIDGASL